MGEVSYVLRVGGSPAPPDLLEAIVAVEVEDHAEQADMLRLALSIGVARDGGRWSIVDAGSFGRLENIRLAAKVGSGPAEPVIDAYVIDTRVAFAGEPGRSTLEVVAMDASALLQLDEKVLEWPDQSDAQIASAIFSDAGMALDVDDTQPARQADRHTTIQRGSDLQFLRRLAERNGFETYVEVGSDGASVGHFHAPRLDAEPQAILNVNLGSDTNVDNFRARNDHLGPTTAAVTGLDESDRSTQPVDVQSAGQSPLGAASTIGGARPRRVLLSGTGLSDSGELQTFAQAVVDRSAMSLRAEGTLYGSAFGRVLVAKKPVLVRGAGQQFSGTWYVEVVRHEFGPNGHVQAFELRRNAAGVTRQERFEENDAAAPQPAIRI